MNPRKFSLIMAGLIWIAVGIRIGSRGLTWLEPYFQEPDWRLSFLALSVLIGLAKGLTVLRKAVQSRIEKLDDIDDSPINYPIGWIKLFGMKGSVVIALMIALGFGLRYARANMDADPNNIFGFIYLGIALALIGSSFFYFKAVPKH